MQTMTNPYARDFGTTLRAARTRFHWSTTLRAFTRISWCNKLGGIAFLEVCPTREGLFEITGKPGRRGAEKKYICWWDQGEEVFSRVNLPERKSNDPHTYILNSQGEVIENATS